MQRVKKKKQIFFLGVRLSLYDYQSKAKKHHGNGLTYLKPQIKNIQQIHKKKTKREHKHNTKENYQTTKGKRKEQKRNTNSKVKQGLKWQ